MDIFHWQSTHGNFGDDLNLWLWPQLLGKLIEADPSASLVGVGTVLSSRHLPVNSKIYTFGAGTGYGSVSAAIERNSERIYGVRGPLSANVLNLDDSYILADPAILIPKLYPNCHTPRKKDKRRVLFVPHIESLELANWEQICERASVEFVNATHDSHLVIEKIANADLVLAESMHAAIIADAYRVPWLPVWSSLKINKFKWTDWALAVGATVKPIMLRSPSLAVSYNNVSAKLTSSSAYHLKSAVFDRTIVVESVLNEYKKSIAKGNRKSAVFTRKILNKFKPMVLNISKNIEKYTSSKNTVQQLIELSKCEGVLSDEGKFNDSVNRLSRKLDIFKRDLENILRSDG